VKQLFQLAGASSLSMKPAAPVLLAGPVLVLGVEGPSHSFVRFKSYSATARSTAQLWVLPPPTSPTSPNARTAAAATSMGESTNSGGTGSSAEWGVLASSSSRYGILRMHALYLLVLF
jgi:hypothetical protein